MFRKSLSYLGPKRTSQFVAVAATAWSGLAHAIPMAHDIYAPNITLSGSNNAYNLMVDSQDPHLYYVAPREGHLGSTNGMPELSFATTERANQKFGILNAVFDFAIPGDRFDAMRDELRQQDPQARLRPLPFSQTTPVLALAGVPQGADQPVCFEAQDFVTGEAITQCLDLVFRTQISAKGPTLGEKFGVSLVLGPSGAEVFPKLLKGGAGIMVNMEGVYRAALPAFKATIDADVKKLYESYAWYAGYHDGICTDISISDFFEKQVLCTNNNLNAAGGACSIKVTYTDNLGRQHNNLFDVMPSSTDDADIKRWYEANNERLKILWTAMDGLRKQFEQKFLTPIDARKANVSKEATRGFALRADRSRATEEGTWHFERDMLGSAGPKRTTIVGYSVCVDVDGETGVVKRFTGGDCAAYYGGTAPASAMIPVVDSFAKADERVASTGKLLPWD